MGFLETWSEKCYWSTSTTSQYLPKPSRNTSSYWSKYSRDYAKKDCTSSQRNVRSLLTELPSSDLLLTRMDYVRTQPKWKQSQVTPAQGTELKYAHFLD